MKHRIEIMNKRIINGLTTEFEIEYAFTHFAHNRKNVYHIRCHIGGLEVGSPCLRVMSAEGPAAEDSNEETLTEAAAIEAFEEAYDA